MIEFELFGNEYRAEKLDAFNQLDVSCYLAPIIPPLIPVFLEFARNNAAPVADEAEDVEGAAPKGRSTADLVGGMAAVMQPFADGLAKMPAEHRHFVMSTCLSVVRRKTKGNWAAVWTPQGGSMFEDMDLGVMLPLIVRVVQDSLGPFIAGLLTAQMSSPAK